MRRFVQPPAARESVSARRSLAYRVAACSLPMVLILLGGWSGAPSISGQGQTPPASAPGPSPRAVLDQYCVTCHSDAAKTGGLTLARLDPEHPVDGETWEKVIKKLRAGLMPPSAARRPDRATLEGLRRTIETSIDSAAAAKPDPGATTLHRLNRNEYANVIRDLLALDVETATMLPPDDSTEGFDNIADVLGTSPALIERYVGAAGKISRLAVGNTDLGPLSVTYKVRGDLSQDRHIEGLPVGTRGGIVIRHNFPVDGEYLFKFSLLKVNFGPQYGGAAKDEQLELSVNGERVKLIDLRSVPYYYIRGGGAGGGPAVPLEVRLPIKAGPQTVAVTFVKKSAAYVDDLFQRFDATTADLQTGVQFGYTTVPHLSGVEILGPYNITGPGETPSRARIFVCRPASAQGSGAAGSADRAAADETACARTILSTLARRAFRRPVTAADLAPLLSFYRTGRQGGDFDAGIEMGLRRILTDPNFVFRFERDPANLPAGTPYRLSDVEIASRLSFFLWSSIPDEELLRTAEQGALKDPAVLERQVRRMLGDPRSRALVSNFAGQWLFLRELRNRNPDVLVYPNFDDNLRQAFQRETELLFDSVVHEDRSVFDLMNADYTFVNERLAKHYGIPNVYGSDFRRVAVADQARRGLLGQGSMLTVTSAPNRTSPVTRGAWILENLLGTPPPLPPPNVPAFPEKKTGQGVAEEALSVRDKMVQHRTNQPCLGCHQIMDPIGLALENFDGVGHWRTAESGVRIDASGKLVDGTPVDGAESLRRALLNYPDAFVQTMTEKLLMYGVGRVAHYYDMPAVRAITREAARHDYRFSSLVLAIVKSDPFQMRTASGAAPPAASATNR
ncbi:MAG: DUF1592 domain-containing protein [Acidobacteriota bacterium]